MKEALYAMLCIGLFAVSLAVVTEISLGIYHRAHGTVADKRVIEAQERELIITREALKAKRVECKKLQEQLTAKSNRLTECEDVLKRVRERLEVMRESLQ